MSQQPTDYTAKIVLDMIGTKGAEAMFAAGMMMVPRPNLLDPTSIPADLVPRTRAYQFMHIEYDRVLWERTGWSPVQHTDHPGLFAPVGTEGHIIINGLGLFSKPKHEVDAERASSIQKAQDQSDNFWKDKGFEGTVRTEVQTQLGRVDTSIVKEITDTGAAHGDSGGAIVTEQVRVPPDLMPHVSRLLSERDRILSEGPLLPPYSPSAKADAMLTAITNLRAKLKQEADDAASKNPNHN